MKWLTGDALKVIKTLDAGSVDLICSSPPFLALRNYNDLDGQWGSEANPAAFLDNLLTLTEEFGRVLSPFGSIAIELGDSFSGSGGAGGDYNKDGLREGQKGFKAATGDGWPLAKSLTGIPTLYAWSLAYGRNLLNPAHTFQPWRIRNIIVWGRSNPPVGALGDKYRPATSYITVATRSPKRWFDLDAVRNESKTGQSSIVSGGYGPNTQINKDRADKGIGNFGCDPAGAPPLDHWTDPLDTTDLAWTINSAGSSLAHYAMWPPKLAERLILSMCPAQVCRECEEPRRRIVGPAEYVRNDSTKVPARLTMNDGQRPADGVNQHTRPDGANRSVTRNAPTVGWSDCGHNNHRPGHVLDPFAGTGTTLAVAELHNRDATGIDLDPANRELVDQRRREVKRNLFDYDDPNIEGQTSLL